MSKFHFLRNSLVAWTCLFALLGSVSAAHTVKKGDTLYSIARANGVSVQKLMSANGIKNATSLQIGHRLVMPGKSAGTTKRTATRAKSVSLKATRPASSSSKGLVVVIDPGHGGRDRGAVWGGVRESNLNLKTAFKLRSYLQQQGYKVVMTRTSDRYVSLSRRAATANRYRNSVFVSIHYNATRETWVGGAETFHGGSKRSRYLASSVQRNLARNCKVRNRGTHYRGFAVLRKTNGPAILAECGFISNSRERGRCNTSSFQDAAARAILQGIQRYDRAY